MKPILFLDMDGVIADLGSRANRITIEECKGYDDPLFWECLPKLPWADALARLCVNYFQVYILTTPCGPASIIGKHNWMKRHYPALSTRMIYTAHKHLLAAPLRILVDDDPGHCARFRESRGIAVEVPNPIRFPDRPQFPPEHILITLVALAKGLTTKES